MTITVKQLVEQRAKIGAWLLVAVAVAAAPVTASAVASTANTTINATVAEVISITSVSPVTIALTPTAGGVVTSASDTVTVNTNDSAGFVLTVMDSDATVTLVNGGNSIAAHSGTKAVPTALATNTWGVAVVSGTTGIGTNGFDASYSVETNNAASTSKWAGMPASGSPMMLKTTAAVATNDTTTVWYGVNATSAKVAGTYSDTVTYTATTN